MVYNYIIILTDSWHRIRIENKGCGIEFTGNRLNLYDNGFHVTYFVNNNKEIDEFKECYMNQDFNRLYKLLLITPR